MSRDTIMWALSGLIIGVLLGLMEIVVLVTQAREMFFHTAELGRTIVWTIGILASVGVLGFTVIGIIAHGMDVLVKRTGLDRRPLRLLIIFAIIAFVPLYAVFWQLTKGPQASQIPARILVVALGALMCALVTATAVVKIPGWVRQSPNRGPAIAALSLILSSGIYLVDLNVLVRLYPVFHFGLALGSFAIGGIGLRLWLSPPKTTRSTLLVSAGIVVVFALGLGALCAVRGTQNPRFVITEKTTIASDVLAASYFFVPPEETLNAISPAEENTVQNTPSGFAITRPGANLFLITVDAMRFDRLKLLGAKRQVAPNIDTLAQRSIVFAKAYTPIPHTSYALSSLLTGKYTHPLFDVPGAPTVHETWAEILARFRYQTAAFFTRSVFFIDRARFEPYIRSSYGFSYRKVDYLTTAEERVKQVLTYLEGKQTEKRPLFVWAHFFDPHEPYDPTCTRFGNDPEDRYDCEIWMVDRALGKLIDHIDAHYPNSIVILTSDHGEEFEEHGGRFHGTTLYDEQVRVPLLIHIPGLSHRVVQAPVSLVDLLGTSLSILDIPVPARVRSRNLSGLMAGVHTNLATFSEVHEKAMIVMGDHKLICDLSSSLCQLYNLVSDPGEKRSITAREPKVTSRLKAKLGQWKKSHARLELRPIETGTGFAKWPQAIQKALGGDENTIPELMALLKHSTEPVVRRKAAGLMVDLWNEQHPIDELQALEAETDPVVATWLNLLRLKAGRTDVVDALAAAESNLPPLSNVSRQAVFARLVEGDLTAHNAVLRIAIEEGAPTEDRQRAIRLIGKHGNRPVVPQLISLINNYQLSLEIAAALGRIKDRRAVKPLIKRLKRERFTERKSAMIDALANIGDKRAAAPIAGELSGNEPPVGILVALEKLGRSSAKGSVTTFAEKNGKAVVFSGFTQETSIKRLNRIDRVVARTTAKSDGGSVIVLCQGREAGRLPLFSGQQETLVDITDCSGEDNSPPEITLKIEPEGLDAFVNTVAFIEN